MTSEKPTPEPISHEVAKAAVLRLIAGAFRRDGERLESHRSPRFSIPCRPDQDDDCVVLDYIEQQIQASSNPQQDEVGKP